MYLPLLIIGLALFPAGYALSCLQCDGSQLPPQGRCATNEVPKPKTCPGGGNPRCAALSVSSYNKGITESYGAKTCQMASECVNYTSVALGNIDMFVAGSCCNIDNCNTVVGVPTNVTNGKWCYTCDPKSCHNTTKNLRCTTEQDYCMKLVYTSGGKNTTYKGCASKSACSAQRESTFNTILDRLTQAQVPGTKYCCQGDLCNGAKNTAGSLLVLLAPVLLAFCSW